MIFVLGGRGFVGSAFVRALTARGLPHAIIGRDNYHEFVGERCDLVINADGSSKKLLAQSDPLQDFERSVQSVRASLVDFRFDRYVHISSCDVYPDCSGREDTTETHVPDVSRQSPYGFHRYLAEQCVRHAARHWLVVRLGGMVGPGLRKNPIFDILYGDRLWIDPDSELQFLHTDRVATIVLGLVERGLMGETFNVCGRGVISLREVMTLAGREDIPVEPGSPRVRYNVNVAKLMAVVDVPLTRETVLSFVADQLTKRPVES